MTFQPPCREAKLTVHSLRFTIFLQSFYNFFLAGTFSQQLVILFLQEMVTVSFDGSVLDRIAKIMTYLRLGSSGKVLKKKKKDKDTKGNSCWQLLARIVRAQPCFNV